MNDESHQGDIDIVDRATAALRNTAASESPPPHVVSVTVEALKSRFSQTETNSPEILRRDNERRRRMFRIARYSGLAAAILLIVAGSSLVLFMDHGASPAFGQVVENVQNARSVVHSVTSTLGSGPTVECKYYMQGNFVRFETL